VSSYASGIEEASKRAAHLTRQILAYSGQGRFSLEQINLTSSVRKTIEDLRPSIGSHITLELNLTLNLPWVEADPHQLEQVSSGHSGKRSGSYWSTARPGAGINILTVR